MKRRKVKVKNAAACALVLGIIVSGISYQAVNAKKQPKLSDKKLTLVVGQKKKLRLKNSEGSVKWSSKDKKVAAVGKSGMVTAKKKGTTVITAKSGKGVYTCKVTVKNKKPAVTPKPAETPVPDPQWQEGKKSGTEEDYNKYFSIDMSQYNTKQEGTTLGKIEPVAYHSEMVGSDREAYVYLPPDYSTAKKYPVLYMIHGLGCDREQWVSMQLNNILSNMICSGEVAPFVAVIPSVIPKDGLSPNTFSEENIGAFTLFEQEFLQDLEPYILKNYSVSSDRKDTGVCGLSMGGMEALHLGFSIKDHFNYIGSFSAAPTLNQALLTLEGWKEAPELVMLCTGSEDSTVGNNPLDYHMSLEKNNVDHIWYLYPKGRHDGDVWKNGLVNFLKRIF